MRKKQARSDQTPTQDSIEHVKASINQKKKASKRRKQKRTVARIVRWALVFAVLIGLYFLDRSDISRIKQVKIEGNRYVSTQKIIETLNLEAGERLITNIPFIMNMNAKKIIGIDSIQSTIYYSQGIVNVRVKELPAIGYQTTDAGNQIIFSDASTQLLSPEENGLVIGLPRFVNFTVETLTKPLIETFGRLDAEVILSISEVQAKPDKFDETAMKLVMNDNYYVFANLKTLPLMKSYGSIIDKDDPNARCIYFLEYGPTENSNSATVQPCN